MYSLHMMLAVAFGVTATGTTMLLFMWLLPRQGLGRRLRTKTSPDAPIVVSVGNLTPYLDQLYSRIADGPSSTVQRLSAYFVFEHSKFFDPIALKATIARLKRRHAIFEAWRVELAKDFGLFREGGLSEVKAPSNLGSMTEQAFFQLVDCCKACHRCGLRTFPSFGAPPIFGDGYDQNTHTKANCASSICRPSCGSSIPVLESSGPVLNTDQFSCTPQLSDWPRYDEANDVFTLIGVLFTDSLFDLTKAEARALAIVNLYCDVKKDVRGKAIPNH